MTEAAAARPGNPGPIDLIEIYYAPKEVFARRAEGTRMLPKLMERMPKATPEQLETMKGMGAKWGGVGMFFMVGLIGPLLAGLVLWIVARITGLAVGFGHAVMIATFSFYPMIVEQLVNAAQALALPDGAITSRYSLSLGPARFLD